MEVVALTNTISQQKRDIEDIKEKVEHVEKVIHAMTRKVISPETEVKKL